MNDRLLPLLLLFASACADPLLPGEDPGPPAPLQPGVPEAAPCELDPPGASTLVVTTTDFATGAISIVDPSGELRTDVAVASPDAIPYPAPGGAAVVHRHGYDFVDILAREGWRSVAQHALEAGDAASPNPHAVAFDEDGLAYVTLFGSRSLLVLDPRAPSGSGIVGAIDLSPFADDDGRPEASVAVRCGETLWVGAQRVDVPGGYQQLGPDTLVAIDLSTSVPWDFDAERPGGQGLPLQGTWLKQIRRDPEDSSRLLGLTSGLERIDLGARTSEWLVPPEAFAEVGAGFYQQPLAFDVGPQGRWAWVAAYVGAEGSDCEDSPGSCFDHAQLFEVDLTEASPKLVPFGQPFQALERTLARIGDTLWVGSRETAAPGLYAYDLTVHPPVLTAGPLSTGLPPYSLTAVP